MTHVPIEQVFPQAFKNNTGIFVTQNIMHGEQGYDIDPFPQPQQNRNHFSTREGAKIKYLIMHFTVNMFFGTMLTFTLDRINDRVSSHYVITEKEADVPTGQVIRVVQESQKAWHAGISAWENDEDLNSVSLGIELVNKGLTVDVGSKTRVWYPFDEDQIKISARIMRNIVREYDIHPNHVLGHADIAPCRKQDPGILFPWGQLYSDYNLGAWLDKNEMNREEIISRYRPKEPCPDEVDLSLFLKMLKSYGYYIPSQMLRNPDVNNPFVEAVINAFKAHFSDNQRPEMYNSSLNINDMFWAWALNAKYCPNAKMNIR